MRRPGNKEKEMRADTEEEKEMKRMDENRGGGGGVKKKGGGGGGKTGSLYKKAPLCFKKM